MRKIITFAPAKYTKSDYAALFEPWRSEIWRNAKPEYRPHPKAATDKPGDPPPSQAP